MPVFKGYPVRGGRKTSDVIAPVHHDSSAAIAGCALRLHSRSRTSPMLSVLFNPMHQVPGAGGALLKTGRQEDRKTGRQEDRKTGRQEDRKTERQKDRKTERQKDRKTERQKDRKTERQKDRKTERQKDGKTERRKDGKTGRQMKVRKAEKGKASYKLTV